MLLNRTRLNGVQLALRFCQRGARRQARDHRDVMVASAVVTTGCGGMWHPDIHLRPSVYVGESLVRHADHLKADAIKLHHLADGRRVTVKMPFPEVVTDDGQPGILTFLRFGEKAASTGRVP